MRSILAPGALLALAGCASAAADGEPMRRRPPGTCDARPAQAFVGRMATGEAGAAIQSASGAGVLRWLPPRSVVTMEYAFGRVNVAYDDAMTIVRVSCG